VHEWSIRYADGARASGRDRAKDRLRARRGLLRGSGRGIRYVLRQSASTGTKGRMRMMTPLIVSALASPEREPECLDSHELGGRRRSLVRRYTPPMRQTRVADEHLRAQREHPLCPSAVRIHRHEGPDEDDDAADRERSRLSRT
jgi:hypothetical protein